MKFNSHYVTIVNKAYKSLGFLIRNSKTFKLDTIVRLYNALVRPHLEYASQIWMPAATTHIEHIEKVQKKFLRYLYFRQSNIYPFKVSYASMLDNFGFVRLSDRRNRQAMLFVFYVFNYMKYKDCDLVKYMSINVPKVNLRILNSDTFNVDPSSISPINRMLTMCNQICRQVHIDIFNTDKKDLKRILSETK